MSVLDGPFESISNPLYLCWPLLPVFPPQSIWAESPRDPSSFIPSNVTLVEAAHTETQEWEVFMCVWKRVDSTFTTHSVGMVDHD